MCLLPISCYCIQKEVLGGGFITRRSVHNSRIERFWQNHVSRMYSDVLQSFLQDGRQCFVNFFRKLSIEVKSDDDDGCMEYPLFSDNSLVNLDSPITPVVAELSEEKATNQLPMEPCSLSDIMAQLSMNIVNGEFQTQVSRETVLEDLLLLSESVTWLLKD